MKNKLPQNVVINWYRVATWPSNSIPGHISGQNYKWKRYMPPHAHSCPVYTIDKTWNNLNVQLSDEWIKKMWYFYTMKYFSAIKKEWNDAMCSNTDGPRDYHTRCEVRQKEKANAIWNLLYVKSKILHKWAYLQSRNRLIDIYNRLVVATDQGKGWIGSLGLADANYNNRMDKKTRSYCIIQRTIFNILW